MWGSLFCFKEGDSKGIPNEYKFNHNPSPLEEAFNEEYFTALIHKEKLSSLSVKAFLTTEQRITGLGNGSAQDILFHSGLHPKRKMSTLQDTELDTLYKTIKRVLTEMYQKGGRDTEYDLYGSKGGYRTILSKNTVNQPCPVCHTLIKKESYLGGSIYICEKCQL
ncbi:MAG: hypothetical protein QM644_12605 [Mobilitalea sp.]